MAMSEVDEMLTIRFDSDKTCRVPLRKDMTVNEVKEVAGRLTEHHPADINLIFAGQLLIDDKTLEDYGLGLHTVVHAFCQFKTTARSNLYESDSVQFSPPTLSLPMSDKGHTRFYVYCKICGCVRPGKLRLCCHLCESPLFLVNQDPSNWEEISASTSVRGVCKNNECEGTTPRFYIKCSHSHEAIGEKVEESAVSLRHIQANRRQVECIICQDILSPVLIFPCPPGHVMCLECFRMYALTSLNTRQFVEHEIFGYTLPCPSDDCREFLIEDSHHFYVMGKNEYEKFKHFGTEEYVLRNGGILCPGPDCGMGMLPQEDQSRVTCSECQFVCCKHCKREYHQGSCEQDIRSEAAVPMNHLQVDRQRAERASWERQSLSLIGEISKPCPQCKVQTQRSGGCMHMLCTRCHLEWCWLCVKPWDRLCQENHWFG